MTIREIIVAGSWLAFWAVALALGGVWAAIVLGVVIVIRLLAGFTLAAMLISERNR